MVEDEITVISFRSSMNGKKLFWFCLSLIISNANILCARYHKFQYEPFKQKINKNDEIEKRGGGALIALGIVAIGVEQAQGFLNCQSPKRDLKGMAADYVKYEQELQNLQNAVNLDYNGVVDVSGYAERAAASISILSDQIEEYFQTENDIYSIVDPDFLSKIEEVESNIETNYKDISLAEYIQWYEDATRFSVAFLTVSAPALGVTLTQFNSLATSAVLARANAFAQQAKVTSLTKNIYGQGLRGLNTKFAVRTYQFTSAVNTVLVLFALSHLAYQIIAYERACSIYEENLKAALQNITRALEDMNALRDDVAEAKQNTTEVYDIYVDALDDDSVQDAIATFVNYTEGSSFSDEDKNEIISILNDYQENIGNGSITMAEREKILEDTTTIALPKILKNIYCIEEKVRVISNIRISCGLGVLTLEDLYVLYSGDYENTAYSCSTDYPLDKQLVLEAAEDSLISLNKSETCLLNDEKVLTSVCSLQSETVESIASLLEMTEEDISLVLTVCPRISVPLPSGQVEICDAKEKNTSLSDIQSTFSYWITEEISDIYNACNLSETQKELICEMRGQLLTDVQAEFSNYEALIVEAAYNECPLLSESEKSLICMMKEYGVDFSIIETDEYFKTMVEVYGADVLQEVYDAC